MKLGIHLHSMITVLLVGVCLATTGVSQVQQGAEAAVIGIGHKHTLPSKILGENVDLIVHLPDGYLSDEKRYPVLLFLGSDFRAKFAQGASTLDIMAGGGQIPGIILVGVDLPHGNFVQVPREKEGGTVSADKQLATLIEEIIPFVERTFRSNGYRILYGGSNSGLFAIYAMTSEKLPCQAIIASSPMLGWCPNLITEKTKALFTDTKRVNQFLFLIWSDDDYDQVTAEMPKFVELLKNGSPGWLRWKSEIRHNEGHVPESDFPFGLRALFPDYNPETELMTLSALREHYSKLSARYGFEIDVPEALIFDVGMTLATGQQLDEAQRIFEYTIEKYPRNAQMRSGLGFVFKQRGVPEVAITHFEKALEIDPKFGWATRQLSELQNTKSK